VVQLESVRRLATALRGGAAVPLRVMLVPSLAVAQLPAALRLLRQRHPTLPIEILSGHTREIRRALALREIDLGIGFGDTPTPGLETETVATGHLVCATLQAPTRGAVGITLEAAVALPLVRIHERDPLGALIAEHCARAGLVPQSLTVVQTHHTALVLAEQGFGAAVLDSFTAAARQDARLHLLPIEPLIRVPLVALRAAGGVPSTAAAAFVAALRKVVQA
jgi:DNA-binding transcriptional LysR family regulator